MKSERETMSHFEESADKVTIRESVTPDGTDRVRMYVYRPGLLACDIKVARVLSGEDEQIVYEGDSLADATDAYIAAYNTVLAAIKDRASR